MGAAPWGCGWLLAGGGPWIGPSWLASCPVGRGDARVSGWSWLLADWLRWLLTGGCCLVADW